MKLQAIQNQIADMGIVYQDLQEKVQEIFYSQEQYRNEIDDIKTQILEMKEDLKKYCKK